MSIFLLCKNIVEMRKCKYSIKRKDEFQRNKQTKKDVFSFAFGKGSQAKPSCFRWTFWLSSLITGLDILNILVCSKMDLFKKIITFFKYLCKFCFCYLF